ncbi:hypothetical protein TRAPUB_13418 [Trametes pubescens]|uniref:Uncharacterized protein n=1 Tax=Trametes pubescens TaxID=154538 RepID=A0A1M2VRE3_TRAPU|nr:hypothetical protein TRAPUB_13418 [Trametes pubescens]
MPSLSSVPIPVPSASITPLTPPSDRPVEPVFDDDFSPYSSAALPPDDPWQPFVPLFESFDYGSPCSSPQSSQSSLSSPFLPGTPPLPLPRDHHDPMIPALQNAMTLHASKSSHPTISVHESPSPSDHFDIGALFNSSFNVDPVVQSLDDSWSAWFETFDAHSTPSRSSPPCSYDPLELPWESHTVSVIELKRPNVTVDPLLQVPDYLSSSH